MAFLYTNDKLTEEEIKETTPFTIVTNNIKYLFVTLTKEVKVLPLESWSQSPPWRLILLWQ